MINRFTRNTKLILRSVGLFWMIFLPIDGFAAPYSSQSYVAVQLADLQYEENQIVEDYSLSTVYGRFGALFDQNYALEWRLGTGINGDDIAIGGGFEELSLELFYGAYFLVGSPLTKSIFPYILAGYSQGEFQLNGATNSDNNDKLKVSGASYGVGVDVVISNQYKLNLEYSRYFKSEGVELGGFSLGITYSF